MSKSRKLLKRILSGSKNIRFDNFVALILAFGFTRKRISGSHHIFSRSEVALSLSIQPDKNNRAKPYQVRQFMSLVELHHLQIIDDLSDSDDEAGDEDENE